MSPDFNHLSRVFRALAEPIRLQFLHAMADPGACHGLSCCPDPQNRYEGMCTCEFVELFDMPQPTVSYHLRTLREAKLVETNSEGRWTYYSLNRPALVHALEAFFDTVSPRERRMTVER